MPTTAATQQRQRRQRHDHRARRRRGRQRVADAYPPATGSRPRDHLGHGPGGRPPLGRTHELAFEQCNRIIGHSSASLSLARMDCTPRLTRLRTTLSEQRSSPAISS